VLAARHLGFSFRHGIDSQTLGKALIFRSLPVEFLRMRTSPSIAAALPGDVDIYMVLDHLGGRLGRVWREADEEATDRKTIIGDLMDGQYKDPARIVAFNTAEGWPRDVWADLADEVVDRSGMDGFDVPPSLQNFVAEHATRRPLQLPLPLKGATA
jgi:hypothetical protein